MRTSFPLKLYIVLLAVICCFALSSCALFRIFGGDDINGTVVTPMGDPFFQSAYICEQSSIPGFVPGANRRHCCERKIQVNTDTMFLFNLSKARDRASINLKVAGLLRAELGLSASTEFVISFKEIQRWLATHCRRPAHCEPHTASSPETCDSLYIEQVRKLTGYVYAAESVGFTSRFALENFVNMYVAGADFSFTDTSVALQGGNFYFCRTRKHDPCATLETTVINPEFGWRVFSTTDTCQ